MRLASIFTYPVKGGHRVEQRDAWAEPWGLAGDRRWMLVDPDGVGVTLRETTHLVRLDARVRPGGLELRADGYEPLHVPEPGPESVPVGVRTFSSRKGTVDARPAGVEADAWLSKLAGQPVRLVWLHDPTAERAGRTAPTADVSFADGYPLLLANAASHDAVNDWLLEAQEEPVEITRFRPNIVVTGAGPWAEDDWPGRRLRIGGAVFRAGPLSDRCVVTTIDPETGEKGREPLKILGRYRNIDQGLMFGLNLRVDEPGRIVVGDPVEIL
jgi:uncharacterized protein YcbX